jgi:hypothetical protein
MKREPGSLHGVVARTRLAALRAARLAAVIDEELDRADSDVEDHVGDHVGNVRGAGVPGMLTERSRLPMPPRCGRGGSRRRLSGLGHPHESRKPQKTQPDRTSDSIGLRTELHLFPAWSRRSDSRSSAP